MYIKSIEIKNIRSIEHFHWELNKADEDLAGWHVLIGDNGSGKSTILKAVSLALVGEYQARALVDYWSNWLPIIARQGNITINANADRNLDNGYLIVPNLMYKYGH